MDRADLGPDAFFIADFFYGEGRLKGQNRLFLGKIDGEVVEAGKLVAGRPAARDLRERAPKDPLQGRRVVADGVGVGQGVEAPALGLPEGEGSVLADDAVDGPFARDEVAPAGRPACNRDHFKACIVELP